MKFLGEWLYAAVTFLYNNLTHDYVLTVVVATVILKLIMIPADIAQRKSGYKMAAAQDDIKRIQKKYANDQQKVQQKTMEYYKKHGISPYASCLPMLITLPLFIAFFNGLRLWQNELTLNLIHQIEMGIDPFAALGQFQFLWIKNIFQPDSGLAPVIMNASDFAKIPFADLISMAQKGLLKMSFMGNTPITADIVQHFKTIADSIMVDKKVVADNLYTGLAGLKPLFEYQYNNGWFIMPLLAGATMILQTNLQNKANPTPVNGTNKIMTYAFAALSVYICITNNAAFAIYWMVSNVCSLIMQLILNRVYKKPDVVGEAEKDE